MRKINIIAAEIKSDWTNMNYAAEPFVKAMLEIDFITDTYGVESASSVVLYFLSNAGTWKGETAKRIKLELKEQLKTI